MKYKLIKNLITNETSSIQLILDNGMCLAIPLDEANTDYQEYLKWLDGYEKDEMGEWVKVSESNTPEPADE